MLLSIDLAESLKEREQRDGARWLGPLYPNLRESIDCGVHYDKTPDSVESWNTLVLSYSIAAHLRLCISRHTSMFVRTYH